MDTKEKLLGSIEERLTVYANWINQGGGIRSDASEDLYRELLNTAWEYELVNMNWVRDNFPAIDLGEHQKALEYLLKALAIRERVRPEDHPDLALSYSNLSYTYGELGDHEKELEYDLKALEIRERVLPGNHPDLAQSCNNIAWTYYRLGRLEEAAVHMRRAADIISRSTLPEHHPNRVNYNKRADRLEREARQARGGA